MGLTNWDETKRCRAWGLTDLGEVARPRSRLVHEEQAKVHEFWSGNALIADSLESG